LVEAGFESFNGSRRFVSIPERVLGWLKHGDPRLSSAHWHVSIPERVLGWLKPYLGFLSLSG